MSDDLTQLKSHFEFGKNWARLTPNIDEDRIASAMKDIQDFAQISLAGKTLLDIGCGSGLHSVAAARLGASKIFATDIDPLNVQNTTSLLRRFAPETNWTVQASSILNRADVARLPSVDIVYSWGVLHHTGSMWEALRNAAELVLPAGHLYLMLYRHDHCAPIWLRIKRRYTRGSRLTQLAIRNGFAAMLIVGMALKGRNPVRSIRTYQKNRGMSWYTDITDWVGGYPFEYAEANEVIEFLKPIGFTLTKIKPEIGPRQLGWRGVGSHQYLFQRAL